MSMGNSYSYVADKAGSYVFVATVKDSAGNTQTASSSAIDVKVAHNWKTVTSTENINQSVKIHDIVTTTYEECTICGEKTEPVVTTQSVEHVVARTSYESAHPHQKFNVCRDCSARPSIEGAYYTANGKVQSADKCCICHGHVWLTDEPEEVNGEWREFCMHCGRYRTVDGPIVENCQHGVGYVNSRDIDELPAYTNINDQYFHMVYCKSYTEAECTACGETLQMSISTLNQREAHVFNNKGICDLCGYVSLNGTYDTLDRYDAYISSNYYSNDRGTVYVGVGSPMIVMLYDKFEGKYVRASNADVTLTLNDPNGVATLRNGDVVVANNSGTFSVTVSYLGQAIGTINIGATVLSVKDEWFEYHIQSSGVVRLEDMDKIDWDDGNVLLTTTTSMGEYSSTKNNDGSQTVTFNAYNNSAVVVGIAVYDANGKQVGTTKLIKPHWETGSVIEGGYRTFSSTLRIWDGKSFNGVETQVTEMSLNVPAGGCIQVVQMNEDPTVYAANIAEMFLGSIKIYNDAESLVNPTNLKEVQTLIEKLGKDEYYEIIRNYLIRTYGTNFGDLAFVAAEEAGDAIDAEQVLEALASESDDILAAILSSVPETVGSTLLDKGEDAALYTLAPYLYYIKHGTQSLYDTSGMHELLDMYNECMNNGTNYKYVSHIIAPQGENNEPSLDTDKILTISKRNVVVLDDCNLRGVASQEYQYFVTVPANAEVELIGSITGENGELFYEVIYNGTRGYIPANKVKIQ